MTTLYIDIYFLTNFTVDMLGLFFAFKASHISPKIYKIFLMGLIAASMAVINLLLFDGSAARIILTVVLLLIFYIFLPSGVTPARRIKFIILFYIASFIISGIVNFSYGILDTYFKDFIYDDSQAENRKILIFALIILLIIGVFRGLIMVFSNSISEKNVRMYISLEDKEIEFEAMIDTGNLVKDPMNMNPVVFLKRKTALKIFPESVTEISKLGNIDKKMKKRVRLIPVTRNGDTHIMTGIRVDEIGIYKNGKKQIVDATVVIDKEEGTFGGYEALVPYVTCCEII